MLELISCASAAVLREASPWDGGGDAAMRSEKGIVHV